jgi:hypothetical protein
MERKRVEAFASENWLPTASPCLSCGASIEVMLEAMDITEQTAMARLRAFHREYCDALEQEPTIELTAAGEPMPRASNATVEVEEVETAGWGFAEATLEFNAVAYPLLEGYLDVLPAWPASA